MTHSLLSRRAFLGGVAATAASPWLAAPSRGAQSGAAPPNPSFRFVHLTDIHVQPELKADQGLVACLAAVQALEPGPDFILTGGDLVMDVFDQTHERAKTLFSLYRDILAQHAPVPVYQCLGNHDVFGWSGKQGISPADPWYGKKMAQEMLAMPDNYYQFDHKGWRFYVLDDIQPAPGNSYQAYLDEAQWQWLERGLQTKPAGMPAAVVCHIPILTVTVLGGQPEPDNNYHVSASVLCRDADQLVELFSRHNVRLALSGHLHQVDWIQYRGVTFICGGAVCGGWWKGPNAGFEEGFGVVDVQADGRLAYAYHDYGWNPQT